MDQMQSTFQRDVLFSCLLTMDPLTNYDFSQSQILLKDIFTSVNNPQLILNTCQLLMSNFIRENVTGPSSQYMDSTKKIQNERLYSEQILHQNTTSDQQPWIDTLRNLGLEWFKDLAGVDRIQSYNEKYLKTDNCIKTTNPKLIDFLSLGGETFNHLIKYKQFLAYTEVLLSFCGDSSTECALWVARTYMVHNEILYTPVQQCQERIMQNFPKYLQAVEGKIPRTQLSQLYVEYSGMLLFYYKYSTSQKYLTLAEKLLSVHFELTGKLGKRTKYQEDKTAQLTATAIVAETTQEDLEELQKELQSLPDVAQVLKQVLGPQTIQLDEESILYETPLLDPEQVEKNVKTGGLSVHEHILLLGVIENLHKTVARDEILQEQTEAYLNLMLDKSNNWLVFSKGLLLRSLNEFSKFKRMERALTQLQVLVDQYNDETPLERDQYYFAIHYPDIFTLNKILGQQWMKLGGMASGYEIFSKLEMWDDCIECLVGQGELQKACSEIEKFISKGTASLKMKCILGEVRGDPKILLSVWEESGRKFARAKRSLGEYYFFKLKDYAESAKAYEEAVLVNAYHANSWFIMGCAYMRLGQFDLAIRSFGQTVSIDESNGEAWANMASCLQSKGDNLQAMAMLEQGVKYHENDYRMWSNLLNLSLRNKKFNRFYACIEKLINLNHRELIDTIVLSKINQTFKYTLSTLELKNVRQIKFTRDRVDRLYQFLTKEIGQNYEVWDFYADGVELFITAEDMFKDCELLQIEEPAQQLEDSKVRFQEQFDQKQSVISRSQEKIYKLRHQVADFRLKSVQMLMRVGWEVEKKTCQALQEQMKKLIPAYRLVKKEEDLKGLQMLIQQVVPKIESCLEIVSDIV